MTVRKITVAELHAEFGAQGVKDRRDIAFRCVVCGTVQSMRDFIAAGCTPEQAEQQIGFSCIGRHTDAGPFKGVTGKGCDWTLGGLFTIHTLEVVTPEGKSCPSFEPATPEQAQAHARKVPETVGASDA